MTALQRQYHQALERLKLEIEHGRQTMSAREVCQFLDLIRAIIMEDAA